MPNRDRNDFFSDFFSFAHDHQRPPERANSGEPWTGGRSLEKVARILGRK
jgi:hypothetical protein